MSGENLPLVCRVLGHRCHRTTVGYAHPAEAEEKVGVIIVRAMIVDMVRRWRIALAH